MTFTFVEQVPPNLQEPPVIVSSSRTLNYTGREYLLLYQENKPIQAFEIRYSYHCSPFKEAAIIDNLLLVGHEGYFYLFDLLKRENILAFELSGYFAHFYTYQNYFYVADAGGLYCIDKKGEILWKNTNLGVDGVIVEQFTEDKIYGSGEWNPPGGWVDFEVDLQTGKTLYQGKIR